jgi:hypothetical protein
MEKKENAKHYRNMSITRQMDTLAFDEKTDTEKITRAAGIRKSLERRLLNWLG